MADAVVNFLVENLLQIVKENWELIKGAQEEFNQLLYEAKRLNSFLDDAAQTHSNSSVWEGLIQDVRKTVHKAEDVIDKFLVEAKLHQGKFIDIGHSKKVRNLALEIKDVITRVEKIRKENSEAFQARPDRNQPVTISREPQDPLLGDDEVVGFNKEAEYVINLLVGGSTDLVVVPIWGMPGLGKTTLARKIQKDSESLVDFTFKIWVYVGQSYDIKTIFIKILKELKEDAREYQDEKEDKLARRIREIVAKWGKCLIILDDVWKSESGMPEVVDMVKKAFPENNKGHRIMLTTRGMDVANYANKEPHILKFLSPDESFELLEKRVFGKESCPDELENLGRSIATKCSGVPLSIVVIAGALRGRMDEDYWERVKSSMGDLLVGNDPNSCSRVVEMSYNRLPAELKLCFLYCGIFPGGFDVPAWKVIRLWIAEGLIKSSTSISENTAEYYLKELVNRSLLIVVHKSCAGKIKTFRVHDMLRLFCKEKAGKENLFSEVCRGPDQALLTATKDPDTSRRLSMQSSLLRDFISTLQEAEHVRSFLCFSSEKKRIESVPDIKLIHESFPLIRVLEIESFKFELNHLFYQLYHLRYISISGDFTSLPAKFDNLWNLHTLIVNTTKSTFTIKANIWKMSKLRHLHINTPAKLQCASSSSSSQPGGASELQILSTVAPESCKREVLAKACNLKKLSIQGAMDDFLAKNNGGVNNLEELKCLENLKLLNEDTSERLQLPPLLFRFLRTLKKLTLSRTEFAWSEANKLEQLDCLDVLKLKENAFSGKSWNPEAGFKRLKVLWIETADLESWEASDAHYPMLRQLVLISCDKLEAVPYKLADISSLQQMRLENTSVVAVHSAKKIEEMKALKNIKFKLVL